MFSMLLVADLAKLGIEGILEVHSFANRSSLSTRSTSS